MQRNHINIVLENDTILLLINDQSYELSESDLIRLRDEVGYAMSKLVRAELESWDEDAELGEFVNSWG